MLRPIESSACPPGASAMFADVLAQSGVRYPEPSVTGRSNVRLA